VKTKKIKDQSETEVCYKDNYNHISEELQKLDLLIQQQVVTLRLNLQTMQEACGEKQTYISHQEVDWMLGQNDTFSADHPELQAIGKQIDTLQNKINDRVTNSIEHGVFLTLPQLAHLFALSHFEMQTVIICLASELQRKYDKLYSYLQDDITRKKPSIDLVLNLLCRTESERWKARSQFSDGAPLFRSEILHKGGDPQSPSGTSDLASFLKLDQRIMNYLLGDNSISGRLSSLVKFLPPNQFTGGIPVNSDIKEKTLNLTKRYFSKEEKNKKKMIIYLHGPYGAGKKELAYSICRDLNCLLLYLDAESIIKFESEAESVLKLFFRESLLLQSAVYIRNSDIFWKEDEKSRVFLKKLDNIISEYGWLVFISGEKPLHQKGVFESVVFQNLELPVTNVPAREATWKKALHNIRSNNDALWAGLLAGQFRLTYGQIWDAVEFAANQHAMNGGERAITLSELYAACRSQSNQKLGELAIKIDPHYGWEDIVLPDNKIIQLKEICSQVKHRYLVFGEWGFEKKLSYGKGLSVLFTGPPGTGKTMAAEVIAHDLQLDLYKVDLSSVVSKYIGETEKNLGKIFQEAETSNAILFFDEADALFGKRTEVSDAHDRYANIETSYLLQKMEEYEGVVILASNLRENMDDAFTRRIRFIVEFPFPDESSRFRIWKTHFPKEAPVSESIDYEFLSKQLPIAGGNIKNIVLNSAFIAAENGRIINMEHINHGAKREFEKIGKLWNENIGSGIGTGSNSSRYPVTKRK
jgi:SpoVK/Ycf46/Vps4 family AAA+-type ATPase